MSLFFPYSAVPFYPQISFLSIMFLLCLASMYLLCHLCLHLPLSPSSLFPGSQSCSSVLVFPRLSYAFTYVLPSPRHVSQQICWSHLEYSFYVLFIQVRNGLLNWRVEVEKVEFCCEHFYIGWTVYQFFFTLTNKLTKNVTK